MEQSETTQMGQSQGQSTSGGFERGHYLRRSWNMLTGQRGWAKPVLVLAAARFVPVFGMLGVEGYAQEWGRLTAWNVDAAPKQKDVRVGKLISSGWRATLVALGWNLILFAAYALLDWVFGMTLRGSALSTARDILEFVCAVVALLASAVVCAASLRATVYQRLGAGYRFDRIWDMCRRDFGGLMRMVGIELVGNLVGLLVTFVFGIGVVGALMPSLIEFVPDIILGFTASGYASSGGVGATLALHGLLSSLAGMIPVLVIMAFCLHLVEVTLTLLVTTGVALWMRQFDVPRWGRSADPLPEPNTVPGDAAVRPDGMGAQEPTADAHSRSYERSAHLSDAKQVVEQVRSAKGTQDRASGPIILGPAKDDAVASDAGPTSAAPQQPQQDATPSQTETDPAQPDDTAPLDDASTDTVGLQATTVLEASGVREPGDGTQASGSGDGEGSGPSVDGGASGEDAVHPDARPFGEGGAGPSAEDGPAE